MAINSFLNQKSTGENLGRRLADQLILIVPYITAILALLVMGSYLAGSFSGIIQIKPDFAPMKFNTALLLLCLSVAIIFQNKTKLVGLILSFFVIFVSILTFSQYFTNTNIGIDELFVKTNIMNYTSHAGRMSPQVIFVLVLLAIVQILRTYLKRFVALADMMCFLAFTICAISVLEYSSSLSMAFAWGSITRMGFHTSLSLGALTLIQIFNREVSLLSKIERRSFFSGGAFIICGLIIWLVFFDFRATIFRNQISTRTMFEGEFVNRLAEDRSRAMQRMADRMTQLQSQIDWSKDIQNYFDHYKDLKKISLGPWKDNSVIEDATAISLNAKWSKVYVPKEPRESSKLPVYFYFTRNNKLMVFEIDFAEMIYSLFLHDEFYTSIIVNDKVYNEGEKPNPSVVQLWGQTYSFKFQNLIFGIQHVPLMTTLTSNQLPLTLFILFFILTVSSLIAYSIRLNFQLSDSHNEIAIANRKLTGLVDSVPIGIFQLTPDGGCSFVSQKFKEITGLSDDKALGYGWIEALHPDEKNKVFDEWSEAVKQRRIFSLTYRYLHPLKGEVYVRGQAVSLKDEKNNIIGYIGGILDISREVFQEKTVEEQRLQLIQSERMRALGQMAGGIAHEINNPLAIIEMQANLIREMSRMNRLNDGMVQNMTNTISSLVVRISSIIRGLRAFARDGHQDPFLEVDLKETLNDTFSLCRERFERDGVELTTDIPSGIKLSCRPSQISQVVVNLLNNSLDAVVSLNEKWVKVLFEENFDYFLIKVIDSGPGVPKELQKKLMEPFFTTKEVGKGTGLGLSISMGIMKAHGGDLVFMANESRTTFVMKLPKKIPELRKK